MAKKRSTPVRYVQPHRYPSPNIPLAAIRRFARRIAERFHPEKIILFGSYAYGQPHAESDVDLLVVMPAYDVVNQSIRIEGAFDREFSRDLIVRTPKQIERGLKQDNWFLREIIEKGKVLYEAPNGAECEKRDGTGGVRGPVPKLALQSPTRKRGAPRRARSLMKPETAQWVRYAEEDWQVAKESAGRTPPHRNAACFHCQQSAEKYLKALLQETGLVVPRTHDLPDLLDLLLPHEATLAPLRRALRSLTRYAVQPRYPGVRATTRRMQAALRQAERVRRELRARLGLPP